MAYVDIEMGNHVVSSRYVSRARIAKLPAPSYQLGVPGLCAVHAVPLINGQDGKMSDELLKALLDIEGL
jgi:hypothetical protein